MHNLATYYAEALAVEQQERTRRDLETLNWAWKRKATRIMDCGSIYGGPLFSDRLDLQPTREDSERV